MRRNIRAGLDIEFYDLDLLVKHARAPCPPVINIRTETAEQPLNLRNSWIYWNWIKDSKRELNNLKSKQLRLSARLVEKYPRILKRPLDPSQGAPRPNTAHLVSTFEVYAMRSLGDRNLYHNWHKHWCIPGTHLVELVPYDRYLWLLFETLDKHPFDVGANGLEDSLARVSLQNKEQGIDLRNSALSHVPKDISSAFVYPEEIADSLRTVLKGLMYIYTEPPLTVPRIRWPQYGNESSEKRPEFFVGRAGHENTLQTEYRCVNRHIKPHNQREYEWLAAFVKVVTWIELHIGPMKEDF
ncbi:hypothetical protein EYC84_004255 [Monilinia fructicola]|uniref:Uncharacterized protein n=1 Tax=Monilinia fructicola TaxID=38448 RepID=A0A5M9JZR0_MONFR|nr:hypothetical protein EYC84_004255 [Monilinia fructicola]